MAVADDHIPDIRRVEPEFLQAFVHFSLDRVVEDGIEQDDALRRRDGPRGEILFADEIQVVEHLLRLGVPALARRRCRRPAAAATTAATAGTTGTTTTRRRRIVERQRRVTHGLPHAGMVGSGGDAGGLDMLQGFGRDRRRRRRRRGLRANCHG
jgi:hypothetical protein